MTQMKSYCIRPKYKDQRNLIYLTQLQGSKNLIYTFYYLLELDLFRDYLGPIRLLEAQWSQKLL